MTFRQEDYGHVVMRLKAGQAARVVSPDGKIVDFVVYSVGNAVVKIGVRADLSWVVSRFKKYAWPIEVID